MPEVITCGEALVAVTPLQRGRLDESLDLRLHVAGAESNAAIALARLGISTAFWGAVGTDPFGSIVRARLAAEGVDITHLERRSESTALLFKEWYGLADEPQIYYYRTGSAGSLWECQANLPEDLKSVRWVHCSGISAMVGLQSRQSLSRVIAAARLLGIPVSLDLNVRAKIAALAQWRERLDELLADVTVIFSTTRELFDLWAFHDPMNGFTQGRVAKDSVLIIKDDDHRVFAYTESGLLEKADPWRVLNVVDSVGAGDGLAAGVIAGRLKGWAWRESLRLGALVGALAVSHPGDFEGYPYGSEAEAMLAAHWTPR